MGIKGWTFQIKKKIQFEHLHVAKYIHRTVHNYTYHGISNKQETFTVICVEIDQNRQHDCSAFPSDISSVINIILTCSKQPFRLVPLDVVHFPENCHSHQGRLYCLLLGETILRQK